jgi:LDH2 family malate/lactate/ureidoglycolate dehydrogenase
VPDVVASDYRLSDERALKAFCERILQKVGVSAADAEIVADVLVTADLRGIASHGVSRLASHYVERIRAGALDPSSAAVTVRETDASLVVDARNGLGHPVAKRTMQAIVAKAESNGAAFGTVRNSNHFGIAGYYAMMALDADLIGFASTNSTKFAAPTFGKETMLGTNPLAIAVPAEHEPPFVLDFATTTVPRGKIETYARDGKPLATGWATDADGIETVDAKVALSGALLPLGGFGVDTGGHKGYGLALMVDIFCGVMAGGMFGTQLPRPGEHMPGAVSHFFAAFRVDGFRDVAEFKRDMDRELHDFKNSRKTPGYDRVYVAGEIEHETTLANRANGVPLHADVWRDLEGLAESLGVAFDIAL